MARVLLTNFIKFSDKSFIQANIKALKDAAEKVAPTQVATNEEGRLDLISDRIYRTVDLKWVIMYVNDIFEVEQLQVGRNIKFPPMSVLSNLSFDK